ncbi:unnamed protein product [Debaryomyces tyrocola]|nr:unnamed protein product [Debaryomyces tyrocola]
MNLTQFVIITSYFHTDQVFSVFADVAIIEHCLQSKSYFALMHLLDDTAPECCKSVKVKRNII